MSKNEILIYVKDYEALIDLQGWLSNEFDVISIENGDTQTLGEKSSGIKVIFEFVKDNWGRFITIFKNWIHNYNKDIEFTLENGAKKMDFKCPSKRVSDDQLDKLFASIDDFYKE